MVGKRDPKGKFPMRRVSIAPDDDYSPPPSPGPSHFGRKSSQGSPVPSHVSFASHARSRPDHNNNQPTVSAASASAPAAPASAPASAPAATTATQVPVNRFSASYNQASQPYGNYWRPVIHGQGGFGPAFAPMVNQFSMAAQQPPAPPSNPPDELGPPPPPPPPPAIPPIINPHGVHFQPQVPGTELGPMTHHYVPRHDPYGATGPIFPGLQMPTYMANGATMPMQSLPIGVASATAPMNPIVVQQPGFNPMMVQNHCIPGGPPLMLPNPHQVYPITGIPPHMSGVPAQPPVHVEPAMGVGLTPNETIAQNMRIAQNNQAYEPQDFKPADPNPYRMYWFRELDGHWALFHRRQIDRLDVRWYRTDDGVFYAIRLSE